jgi:hypothetical protein
MIEERRSNQLSRAWWLREEMEREWLRALSLVLAFRLRSHTSQRLAIA